MNVSSKSGTSRWLGQVRFDDQKSKNCVDININRASLCWPSRTYVVSKICPSALTRIQQRDFDKKKGFKALDKYLLSCSCRSLGSQLGTPIQSTCKGTIPLCCNIRLSTNYVQLSTQSLSLFQLINSSCINWIVDWDNPTHLADFPSNNVKINHTPSKATYLYSKVSA